MAEINHTQANMHKKSVAVKMITKKSTKVDLTPMVDLGFLLITFFVFTTTMSMTTAMEMNETKDGNPKPVPQSGAMTILLGKGNNIYYYFGALDSMKLSSQFKSTNFKEIRKLIATKKKITSEDKLMYIIKVDDESTFGNAMSIIDEMLICGVKSGHYAEDKISDTEKRLIKLSNEVQ